MASLDVPIHLAVAFVEEPLEMSGMVRRGRAILSGEWSGLRRLARRTIDAFGEGMRPRESELVHFLASDGPLQRAVAKNKVWVERVSLAKPRFVPTAGEPCHWDVPGLSTSGELSSFLGITVRELGWLRASSGRLDARHYERRWIRKRSGSWRLLEAPRPRLKKIQRIILSEILAGIPAHPAACGFVPGRSVLDFVAPHVEQSVVLRLDLRDFFPSIRRARVTAAFMTVGYPEAVAHALADLCSCETPSDAWVEAGGPEPGYRRSSLRARHLPQGAPTSPALANLCAYRLDLRLSGLAVASGARFTRYADDLAFSGNDEVGRRGQNFLNHAAAIAIEEGFAVNHRKTRVQRSAVRQELAGVVVNARPGVPRVERDRLKAILHRAARYGPAGENREKHPDFRSQLRGKIAWVTFLNPAQGKKLMSLFDQIQW